MSITEAQWEHALNVMPEKDYDAFIFGEHREVESIVKQYDLGDFDTFPNQLFDVELSEADIQRAFDHYV